jgi:hypothetical protein
MGKMSEGVLMITALQSMLTVSSLTLSSYDPMLTWLKISPKPILNYVLWSTTQGGLSSATDMQSK